MPNLLSRQQFAGFQIIKEPNFVAMLSAGSLGAIFRKAAAGPAREEFWMETCVDLASPSSL